MIEKIHKERHLTIVLVSHDLSMVYKHASRVYALNQVICCQGTPEEVKAAVERSIDAGFRMIAPGCSFVPMTPGVNIKAMTDAVKNFPRKFEKGKN